MTNAPNEFWLALHELAVAYDREGLTPQERSENIVEQFRRMPKIAQREVTRDLLRVIKHCPDLYPVVVAPASESEGATGMRMAQVG